MNFREFIKTLNPIHIDEEVDLKFEAAAILKELDGTPVYFKNYNILETFILHLNFFPIQLG